MKKIITLLFVVVIASLTVSANIKKGDPVADSLSAIKMVARIDSIIQSIKFDTGKVVIGKGIATVNVPKGFIFLNSENAQKVLTGLWNNPADATVLGLLMPSGQGILSDSSWAIVYTYDEDGHVKDDDAADIKYDELLTQMQKRTEEENAERLKNGFRSINIVGWAQKPFYDKANHKLHWAKELKVGGDSINTLNYNIRMLGRKGVLVMNAIASINNLKDVQNNLDKIMASTEFTKGNTYNDFDSGMDKVAEYGVGGLIAGGILLKTGLLAKLGLLLASAWKIIVAGVVAAVAFLRKRIFGGAKS